eukprot:m.165566 g.165566  ORF g.165566 m.165566 type:complete len:299 (+) comp12579_c0_seq1:87-983(+)
MTSVLHPLPRVLHAVGSTSVWQWLAAITILERVCRLHWSRMGKYLPHMDTMAFSGDAVETGRVHTAVVANFTHGSVSHMVNNVIMLATVGEALETRLGPLRFAAIYLSLGASGWLGSYAYARWHTDPVVWASAAKFQEGLGSSPATYGLAALAAWILPRSTVLGWPSIAPSFWTTAAAVHVVPHLCEGRLHEVATSDVHELVLATAIWSLLFGQEGALPPVVGAAEWLTLYHLHTGLTLARRAVSGTLACVPLTDHPAHLAGTCAAVGLATMVDPSCQSPYSVMGTLCFLGARVAMNV